MKRIEYRQTESGDFRPFLIDDDDLPQVEPSENAEPTLDEQIAALENENAVLREQIAATMAAVDFILFGEV